MDNTLEARKRQEADRNEKTVAAFLVENAGSENRDTLKTVQEILETVEPIDFRLEWVGELVRLTRDKLKEKYRLPLCAEMTAFENPLLNNRDELNRCLGTSTGTLDATLDVRKTSLVRQKTAALQTYTQEYQNAQDDEERRQAETRFKETSERLKDKEAGERDISLNAGLTELLARWERGEETTKRYSTGFPQLDRLIQGGYPSKGLTLIAARPSEGKTAFMTDSATLGALAGNPTVIYSLEMSKDEITERIIRQRTNTITPPTREGMDAPGYSEAMARILCLPVSIDEQTSIKLDTLEERIERRARKGDKVFFIDYLDFIEKTEQQSKEYYSPVEWLAYVVKRLKNIAKRLNIAVVLLVQLNRESVKDPSNPPTVEGLRGSGGLEQSADNVLLLWKSDPRRDDRRQILIGKQRNGKRGEVVDFHFLGWCCRFTELPPTDSTGAAYSVEMDAGSIAGADCLSAYSNEEF